jgi:K+-transporting ATPase ATPase C chain
MNALRMFLWFSLLTGIVYPLFITGIAQWTMASKANGQLITSNGKVVGSALIGQQFKSDKYFWGRPSANDYNALASGGSNLGPTSSVLKKAIQERQTSLMKAHGISDPKLIPSELLYASASGLDPHISPSSAQFQVNRIAKARGIDSQTLEKLIIHHTESKRFGFLGEPIVNVLKLNRALDE